MKSVLEMECEELMKWVAENFSEIQKLHSSFAFRYGFLEAKPDKDYDYYIVYLLFIKKLRKCMGLKECEPDIAIANETLYNFEKTYLRLYQNVTR